MVVKIGVLWDSEVEHKGDTPFGRDELNHTYQVFSEIAKDNNAEVYLANYINYKDGKLSESYNFSNQWKKKQNVELDVVFDKYKFDEDTIELKKEIQSNLKVINNFDLEKICKDKLLTYQRFPYRVPETMEATRENVEEILEEDKAILKPRYDFGGHGIEVIDSIEDFEPEEDILVQRFVDSETGIDALNVSGIHDLRVLVLNGEPLGAYIRTPEEGYLSNVSLGGSMRFVDMDDVPDEAMKIVEEVSDKFDQYNPAYYSVDMIFDSEDKPWILEFNSKPGFNFYNDEEIEAKKRPVMEKLVETLAGM